MSEYGPLGFPKGPIRKTFTRKEHSSNPGFVAGRPYDFIDPLIGGCRYTSAYITNHLYGGYSYQCERGSGSVDYANPADVIRLAMKFGLPIHLAGDAWKDVGRIGFGETEANKKVRRMLHNWSFRQLVSFLEYKLHLAGLEMFSIDPRGTSKTCPRCGDSDRKNRKTQSRFECSKCGYEANADFVAARNIATLGSRYMPEPKGGVTLPEVGLTHNLASRPEGSPRLQSRGGCHD
jgi:predicted RNA-binding Zn-ribbon protein involved in translation (DUF1610 family)